MIFVDSCVWIDFFKSARTDSTRALAATLENETPIFSLPTIVQEILQGVRKEQDAHILANRLNSLNFLEFRYEDAIAAAALCRKLRRFGITSSQIDLQITVGCIRENLPLLTDDGDFARVTKHCALKLL